MICAEGVRVQHRFLGLFVLCREILAGFGFKRMFELCGRQLPRRS
jgi:hypothetical protein